jgi:hypothetical protein
MIIGCDYHPRYQQIAMMDPATGERWSGGWSMRTDRHGPFTRV